MKILKSAFCASLLATMFALINPAANAQGTFSRFTGVVQDTNGAAVAGATVTLINEATNASQTQQTSEGGIYTFDSIQVGSYRIEIEKAGFKKFISGGNNVNANQATTLDVALEIGDVSAVVQVEGAAELVQTSSSGNIGNVVEQQTLEALPIVGNRGRNPLTFINFQPGVAVGANTGGGVHVHGSRDRAFNFTLDGIDNNDPSAGGSNFTPTRTNPDALTEFQVITSNFTAELGRSSGASVSLVTKAGTNDFRGNAFWFYQTPEFHANEYENNLNNVAKRQFVQHIYGGSFGGPIIKNKAFFFTNLQLLRASETRLVTRTVYTAQARQGIFRYVAGNQNRPAGVAGASVDPAGNPLFPNCQLPLPNPLPQNFPPCINSYNVATSNPGQLPLDPTVLRVINLMPAPNNFTTGDGLNTAGFNFAAPQREKQYDFVVRGDYNINSDNTIYARYSQGEQNTFGDVANGGLRRFPDTPDFVATFRNPKNLAINYRSNLTSKITNEFIFGVNRFGFSFNNPDENWAQNPPFILNLPTDPLNNTPTVNNARRFTTYQFVDNLTFIRGAHTFKTGINFRFQRHLDDRQALTTLQAFFNLTNTANIPDLAAFGINNLTGLNATDRTRLQQTINDLLGRVSSVGRGFVAGDDSQYLAAGEGLIFDARYHEYDFYGQDTWKILPNLTIDLGLRWELRPSPSSEGNPILVPDQLVRAGAASSNTLRWNEGKLFDDDLNNLAPSIGFAWDPQNNGKSSIRANYRLAYDRLNTFLISSAVFQTLPGLIFQSSASTTATNQLLLRNGLPNLTPTRTPQELRQPPFSSTAGITVVDPDFKFPQTHQWALSYQRDIGWNFVAEVNYIGRRGRNLTGAYDANQVNLSATDPRCPGQTFLSAFNSVRAGSTNECLINYLVAGQSMTNAGTTSFRSTFATAITQGSVASVAQTLSSTAVTVSGQTRQAITERGFSPFFFQPFPQFPAALNVIDSNDYSDYHGLELILKRRFSQGLSLQTSYTLARSKDTRSFDPAFTVVGRGNAPSASSTPFDISDRSLNYALSDFDRKHTFQALFLYELPFGRGRQFGSDVPKVLDFFLGGWQLSGAALKATGRPFTVYSGLNTFTNAVQSTANCNGCRPDMGRLIQEQGTNFWFSAEQRALFSAPAPGEQGNTGRNFFRGPGTFNLDLALAKRFQFTETRYLEFRFEAQNVTNTPTFGNLTSGTAITNSSNVIGQFSPVFGRIRDNVISFSRKAQIGLKLNF